MQNSMERLRRLRWRERSLQKLYGQEQGREFHGMICRLQKGMGMRCMGILVVNDLLQGGGVEADV